MSSFVDLLQFIFFLLLKNWKVSGSWCFWSSAPASRKDDGPIQVLLSIKLSVGNNLLHRVGSSLIKKNKTKIKHSILIFSFVGECETKKWRRQDGQTAAAGVYQSERKTSRETEGRITDGLYLDFEWKRSRNKQQREVKRNNQMSRWVTEPWRLLLTRWDGGISREGGRGGGIERRI